MEKNTKNASRMQTALNLVSDRVLPVVVNNFRNKLIGVVLAGLVLPQMAYAGHGGGGGGNKGGGHSGGGSAARSMSRPSGSNFKSSANSFKSSNATKSFSQKSSNLQNGGQKQFTAKKFVQPIPAKNGNTGFTGKSLKNNSSLNANASKISGNSGIKSLDSAKSKSWKQFRDNKVTKSDKGILTNSGIKNRGDFDKVVLGGGLGKADPGTRTGGGMGQGGGGGKGNGGGKGQGNGNGGGKHGHHGFPWWAFVTPVVGYPSYPGYNTGYCQPVYQQPVYGNAPVYSGDPVYSSDPIVDPAPAIPANYTAPVPAPSQPTDAKPVNASSDGYVDLVLEDVEYLEPATVTVGPLYLVKVRNQGTKLSDKFRVGAFAQLEGELSDDAPRSVTEVPNLGAGETASVTLRLPATAMKLISTSSAGSAAFNQLLVVVDLDDAVEEIEKSNNVANLDRDALEAAAVH